MSSEELIFDGLNTSQKEAVIAQEGPLLVVAGPGTGKTLTIVRKIAHLVEKGVSPEHIVAVTFTNRAARQMRERAEALLGQVAHHIFIGTFHMLGLKILRDNVPYDFLLCTRNEQDDLIKKAFGVSVTKARAIAESISRAKNFVEPLRDEMKDIFDRYQAELIENHAFDFDDLILQPIGILSDSEVLDRYTKRFKHIIVDEYQDINPAQYRFVRLLAGDSGCICAVGDPDQAIYAFRGADVTNFLNFEKDFIDTKQIKLTENYRSTGTILHASNMVVKNNTLRIEKEISPMRQAGSRITVVSVPDERAEGEFIVHEIEARIGGTSHYNLLNAKQSGDFADTSYSFADFAIIYRTNAQGAAIEEAFQASGIPYQVIGGRFASRKKDMAEIISHLKAYAGRIDETLPKENTSMKELLEKALEGQDIHDGDCSYEFIKQFAALYETGNAAKTLNDFINELGLITPQDDFDPRADAVTLMTLHMAKGLEFRVVFIAGVEDGLLPYSASGTSDEVEEERRLFYVGMTRAKDELFLAHARTRALFGKAGARTPSPFLREIPEEFIERKVIPDRVRKREGKQMELF